MADLILHHYPNSPFSEKVRLILAYQQLPWKSVVIPALMPKPDVLALTGGYRKTPFMQVGADIYCDSALICDLLEHLRGFVGVRSRVGRQLFAQHADARVDDSVTEDTALGLEGQDRRFELLAFVGHAKKDTKSG